MTSDEARQIRKEISDSLLTEVAPLAKQKLIMALESSEGEKLGDLALKTLNRIGIQDPPDPRRLTPQEEGGKIAADAITQALQGIAQVMGYEKPIPIQAKVVEEQRRPKVSTQQSVNGRGIPEQSDDEENNHQENDPQESNQDTAPAGLPSEYLDNLKGDD